MLKCAIFLRQRPQSVDRPLLQADAEPAGDAVVAAARQDPLPDLGGRVCPVGRLPLRNRFENSSHGTLSQLKP